MTTQASPFVPPRDCVDSRTSPGYFDWLGARVRPHFGQLTLWVLLACAVALACYFLAHHGGIHPREGRTGDLASIFSWLPDAVLLNFVVFQVCGALFLVGALLWALGWCVPWSSWLTTLTFTAVVALYLENSSQATHVAHLTNTVLFIHALWYHFYAGEMRTAWRERRFWQTPLYPRWVHATTIFAVGMFYGLSGLSKLLYSGVHWANGLSLQLWVNLWGDPGSFWTRQILEHRFIALALQWMTLVGETAGFLAIVWSRGRWIVGLLLIAFHIGQIAVFGWGFHGNLALLVLFFLPCHRLVERLSGLSAHREGW